MPSRGRPSCSSSRRRMSCAGSNKHGDSSPSVCGDHGRQSRSARSRRSLAQEHLVDHLGGRGLTAEVERANPVGRRAQGGPPDGGGRPGDPASPCARRDRARRRRRAASPSGWRRSCPSATAPCRAAPRPWRPAGAVSSSSARSTDSAPAIEPNRASTRSDRQSPSRLSDGTTSGLCARLGDQPRVGGVDERRAVRRRRGAGPRRRPSPPSACPRRRSRRSISDRRRRTRPICGGGPERVLGHRAAHGAVDALGPPRLLVPRARVARPPLLRPVGVADGHAHHHDRVHDRWAAGPPRESGGPCAR